MLGVCTNFFAVHSLLFASCLFWCFETQPKQSFTTVFPLCWWFFLLVGTNEYWGVWLVWCICKSVCVCVSVVYTQDSVCVRCVTWPGRCELWLHFHQQLESNPNARGILTLLSLYDSSGYSTSGLYRHVHAFSPTSQEKNSKCQRLTSV